MTFVPMNSTEPGTLYFSPIIPNPPLYAYFYDVDEKFFSCDPIIFIVPNRIYYYRQNSIYIDDGTMDVEYYARSSKTETNIFNVVNDPYFIGLSFSADETASNWREGIKYLIERTKRKEKREE